MSHEDNQQPSSTDKPVVEESNTNVIGTFREEIAAASSGAVIGSLVGAVMGPVGGIIGASVGAAVGASAAMWVATHHTAPDTSNQTLDK